MISRSCTTTGHMALIWILSIWSCGPSLDSKMTRRRMTWPPRQGKRSTIMSRRRSVPECQLKAWGHVFYYRLVSLPKTVGGLLIDNHRSAGLRTGVLSSRWKRSSTFMSCLINPIRHFWRKSPMEMFLWLRTCSEERRDTAMKQIERFYTCSWPID